jgi:hypothetical protein
MKKSTTNEFIEKAKLIHGDKYDYSKVTYISNHTKIVIECPIHGEFKQMPYSHLQKHGCKKCNDENKPLKIEDFIKKSNKTHNNKYDYSKVKYVDSNTKIEIICKTHGSFLQNPYQHSIEIGCPNCYEEKHNLTNEKFIKKCINTHGDKYDYSETCYLDSKTKIKINCKKHGSFLQFPFGHLSGQGCKKCTSNISNKEIKFLDYLNIKENCRQLKIGGFLVDAFDENTNTIYEFLGDYWHGNPEIYNKNEINKVTKKTFGELYDFTFFYKFKKLKENGYNIKYIWENDWDNKKLELTIHNI